MEVIFLLLSLRILLNQEVLTLNILTIVRRDQSRQSNISTGIASSVKDQLSGNNGQEDSEASKLDHSVHNDGLSDVSVSHGHVNTIDQQTDASDVLEERHTQGK